MKRLSMKIVAPVLLASLTGGIALVRTADVAIRQAAERAAAPPASGKCEIASVSPCNCRYWSCPWCAT